MSRRITTLVISAKCSDLCNVQALGVGNGVIAEGDGYVPDFMPDEHYGDYVSLEIDVATGKILNWKAPTDAEIKRDLAAM
jgi:hypothetical protein